MHVRRLIPRPVRHPRRLVRTYRRAPSLAVFFSVRRSSFTGGRKRCHRDALASEQALDSLQQHIMIAPVANSSTAGRTRFRAPRTVPELLLEVHRVVQNQDLPSLQWSDGRIRRDHQACLHVARGAAPHSPAPGPKCLTPGVPPPARPPCERRSRCGSHGGKLEGFLFQNSKLIQHK